MVAIDLTRIDHKKAAKTEKKTCMLGSNDVSFSLDMAIKSYNLIVRPTQMLCIFN